MLVRALLDARRGKKHQEVHHMTFHTLLASGLLLMALGCNAANVRVLSDRTPGYLKPLFAMFERSSGHVVQAAFVDKGLLPRLRSRPHEADVVISKTGAVMETARREELLQAHTSDLIKRRLATHFRAHDEQYITITYRARAIFYSAERVQPGQVTSYRDLADPRWRARVCIRSGYHDYNVDLWSQMATVHGLDATRAFLQGLKSNLASAPRGNDRAQVRAIMEGRCDLALANSYYMGIMLANPKQRAWGLAARVSFPDQDGDGALVLRGVAGLTRSNRNVAAGTQLLEFLISDEAQRFLVNTTYAYSVLDDMEIAPANRDLGTPRVADGRFKANFIAPSRAREMRSAVVAILDEIDFDHP